MVPKLDPILGYQTHRFQEECEKIQTKYVRIAKNTGRKSSNDTGKITF